MNGNKIQKQPEPSNAAAKKFIQQFWHLLATEISIQSISRTHFSQEITTIFFERNGRFKRSIFYWWKTCGLIIGFKVGGWKQQKASRHTPYLSIDIAMYIRQLFHTKWYTKYYNEHFLGKKQHRRYLWLNIMMRIGFTFTDLEFWKILLRFPFIYVFLVKLDTCLVHIHISILPCCIKVWFSFHLKLL